MLNLELVQNLYDGLTAERKEELKKLLFGKSRQTMAYFARRKDISFSKIEILADFYQMPTDFFRSNGSCKSNNVAGNNNCVGNVNVNTTHLLEIESLKKQIDLLQREIQSYKNNMASKDEINLVLKELVESLKVQIETYKLRINELQGKEIQ